MDMKKGAKLQADAIRKTGGGPLPGAGIWSIDTKEDNNGNGVWDPRGRRSTQIWSTMVIP